MYKSIFKDKKNRSSEVTVTTYGFASCGWTMDASLESDVVQSYPEPEPISLEKARELMEKMKPTIEIKLEPGSIKRINDKLIVEKTKDGEIIIYEVLT